MKKQASVVRLENSGEREISLSTRPFILVSMSMSADGKIATANRVIDSFGSARDLAHLYELRATADAVMCGAGTVNAGGVFLDPGPARYRRRRTTHGLAEYNLRVIVSGRGHVKTDLPLFKRHESPTIILTTSSATKKQIERLSAVADEVVVCGIQTVDWYAALGWLWERWNVRRLVCEGGAQLNASLFAARAVDEVHLTICPYVFGGEKAPTIADGGDGIRLADAVQLELVSKRVVQGEAFCVFRVLSSKHAGASTTTNSPRKQISLFRA